MLAAAAGAEPATAGRIEAANSAGAVLAIADDAAISLGDAVAAKARKTALQVLDGKTEIEVLVFDRAGRLAGSSGG